MGGEFGDLGYKGLSVDFKSDVMGVIWSIADFGRVEDGSNFDRKRLNDDAEPPSTTLRV